MFCLYSCGDTMVTQLKDNTATRELRRAIKDAVDGYEERLLREIARMKEVASDIDLEVQEGMSNRNGDGFQPNEAKKYAGRIVEEMRDESVASLKAVCSALSGRVSNLVSIIDSSKAMPLEQSELGIVVVPEPSQIEVPKE